jgi:hypothetical protein|tara:strand:+ start:31 stop:489 length:459 start_codon:yes stop_codon:yes gene_type:complete
MIRIVLRLILNSFFLIIFVLSLAKIAHSKTLLTCADPVGKSFYFAGGIVPKKDEGWHNDGITGGKFSLVISDNKFDILFFDLTGEIKSSRAEGAQLFPLGNNKINFSFLVNYKNKTSEIFTFDMVNKKLTFSQHKYGNDLVNKRSLMTANCY